MREGVIAEFTIEPQWRRLTVDWNMNNIAVSGGRFSDHTRALQEEMWKAEDPTLRHPTELYPRSSDCSVNYAPTLFPYI